VGEAESIAYVK